MPSLGLIPTQKGYIKNAMDPQHIAHRAGQIVEKIQQSGPQQVRLDGERVLTFMADAPRGYGVRGILVGVYDASAQADGICEDIAFVADSLIGASHAAA